MRNIPVGHIASFLIACLSIVLAEDGRAAEKIYVIKKIYAIKIEGLHQTDGNGAYDAILQGAIEAENLDIEVIVLPPKRAFNSFQSCETCCISPANKDKEFYDYPEAIQTLSMNEAKMVIFSPPGRPAIQA